MRRGDRALSDEDARALLMRGEHGVLSTVGSGGEPYGVPLNYVFDGGSIFVHGALEGRKVENLTDGTRVSFCVVGDTQVMPPRFGTLYESVLAAGTVSQLSGARKREALVGFVRKYAPGHLDAGLDMIERMEATTRVFEIEIDHLTGKARAS